MLRVQQPPAGGLRPAAGPAGRRRLVGAAVAVTAALFLTGAGIVVVPALRAGGGDSLTARIAESARDHGLGLLVTSLEDLRYRLDPPRKGGGLSASDARSLARDAAGARRSATSAAAAGSSTVVTLQPRMATPAGSPLPGEGVFSAVVVEGGRPVVQVARVRPDAAHTSYLAGVAWMSGRMLRFVQHPGSQDPGRLGLWSQPPSVPSSERAGLAATFNSGFKIRDARGAYYADGRTVGTLRRGAASFVVFRDGHATVGAWGRDVGMSPDVVSVRQNLGLLVDGGRVNPSAQGRIGWGATIGSAAYVWRSGIGVTRSGDLVYVAGDAMSAGSLGTLLADAGAVRAMELDINPDWVSYMWYSGSGAKPTPHKLVDFLRPAARYYRTTSRDFFAVYAR